jgi:peptidyl-prolyl cis-trans isomerase SurA
MKKVIATILICACVCISNNTNAQTLFTYGNKAVSRQEFLNAYNKNSNAEKPTEKIYRDYLELYARFKLKVQAGYNQRLDTLPEQQVELINFRNQVAGTYMNDEASMQQLINEAFERSLKDINISHIYIPLNAENRYDTVAAFKKITAAYNSLQQGQTFEAVAKKYSADPSVAQNGGSLGFITVFTLPYLVENEVYKTPVNKYSKIVRSTNGYHIIKNNAERKAAGSMNVAHILLAYPPNGTAAQKEVIKQKADSIYNALQKGASFAAMALQYSNDNNSYATGGQIAPVIVGRYEPAFENAVFALVKDGEIAEPRASGFGYHIIQRISHTPVVTTATDAANRLALRQKIEADTRIEVAKQALINRVMKQAPFKKAIINEKHLYAYADSVLANKKIPVFNDVKGNSILFSVGTQKATVADFGKYLGTVNNNTALKSNKTNTQLLQQYINMAVMEYYRNNIEQFNSAFATQLQEFKDGNLLFETMQKNVWEKASGDTTGLKKYYQQHAGNYWWQPGADAIIFTTADEKTALAVIDSIQKKGINQWRTVSEGFDGAVQSDSGRFEFAQLPVSNAANVAVNGFSKPLKNEQDNSTSFVYILKKHETKQPRSFEDARGFVLNDYQTWLEEKWITALKTKYPVKVNEAVLQSLWK